MVYDTYEAAEKNCPEDHMVCGTYRDAECQDPVYFTAPREIDQAELARLSFTAKHGKDMTTYQKWAFEMAQKLEVVR